MHRIPLCRVCLIVATLLSAVAGCPQRDPPQPLAKNLGTPDEPILPTTVTTYDADILSGKAAPILATELAEEADEEDAENNGVDDQDADADEGGEQGAVSDEDRALIKELFDSGINAVVEERIGDLNQLIVPDQQEKLAGLFAQLVKLVDAQKRMGVQIMEKAPQMAAAMGQMAGMPGLNLGAAGAEGGKPTPEQLAQIFQIGDMRMTAEDKAQVTLNVMAQPVPVDLWVVEDEWYIHLPELLEDQELIDSLVEIGELITGKVDSIATRLEDGSLAPEALMPELMQMGQELMPAIMAVAPRFQALAAQPEPEPEPAEAEEPGQPEEGDEVGEAPLNGEVPDDVRQDIEDLLADYDKAEAEKRFDDFAPMHASEQREAADQVMQLWGAVVTAIEDVAAAMNEAMPGTGNPINQMLAQSLATSKEISELRMVAASAIAGTVTEGSDRNPLEFRLVEDEWYVWDPLLADAGMVEALVAILTSTTEKLDALAKQIRDGDVAANAAPASYMTILRELSTTVDELEARVGGTSVEDNAQPEAPPPRRGRGRS